MPAHSTMRLILAIALATSALWSAAGAQLPEVGVYNEAGLQLVDNARTIVQLRLRAHDDGAYRGRFDCASAQLVMREGILEATATIRAGEPTQLCEWVIDLPAGTLAAGGYQVVSTFWRASAAVKTALVPVISTSASCRRVTVLKRQMSPNTGIGAELLFRWRPPHSSSWVTAILSRIAVPHWHRFGVCKILLATVTHRRSTSVSIT